LSVEVECRAVIHRPGAIEVEAAANTVPATRTPLNPALNSFMVFLLK
jgi:hypothetical protein